MCRFARIRALCERVRHRVKTARISRKLTELLKKRYADSRRYAAAANVDSNPNPNLRLTLILKPVHFCTNNTPFATGNVQQMTSNFEDVTDFPWFEARCDRTYDNDNARTIRVRHFAVR